MSIAQLGTPRFIAELAEGFADLRVEQKKKEWEKEKDSYEEEIKYKSQQLSTNRDEINELNKEIEALKSNLYSKED